MIMMTTPMILIMMMMITMIMMTMIMMIMMMMMMVAMMNFEIQAKSELSLPISPPTNSATPSASSM